VLCCLSLFVVVACGDDDDVVTGDGSVDSGVADSSLSDAAVDGAVDARVPSSEAVGDPCLPREVPDGGFVASEVFMDFEVEQCAGEQCLVYRLEGDPSEGCDPETSTCPDA